MVANFRSRPTSDADDLDALQARQAVLVAELAENARRQAALVRALGDRAARLRPVALSIRDVAASLNVTDPTIRKWIRHGLPAYRPVGGDLVVLLDDLSDWIRKQ